MAVMAVIDTESVLVAVGLLLLVAVGASKVARRFGVPTLLLFMGIGMLAGSEGVGGIDFTDFRLAQSVGITALALLLFAGGLDTDVRQVRTVVRPALSLATVGVAVTCVVVGLSAHVILDLPLATAMLLGAIVSSTDAAAVFSVLRSQSIGLRGEIRPVLELESGANDPMAVFLTVGLLTLIDDPDTPLAELLLLFGRQMVIGAIAGYALARLGVWLINRSRLDAEGLYPVLTLSLVLLIFGATAGLGGSGFLAVYLAGLVIGDARIVHRHSLRQFHDAIAWLAQIAMFLVLGLLAFPSRVASVAVDGLMIAAVLVLVARPIATFLALPTRRFSVRAKLLLSWVGLRGAVPIILATFALAEGIDDAEFIFNIVFFTVLVSVLVQGTTVATAARLLGVSQPAAENRPLPLAYNPIDEHSDMELHAFTIGNDSPTIGAQLVDLGLPRGVLVLLVTRGDTHLVPEGSTSFEEGDRVLYLAPGEAKPAIEALLAGHPHQSEP